MPLSLGLRPAGAGRTGERATGPSHRFGLGSSPISFFANGKLMVNICFYSPQTRNET